MSKKRVPSIRDLRLNDQRNCVRGLVGMAKGWDYDLAKNDRARRLRNSMRTAMIRARANLPVSEYDNFLAWMDEQTELQAGGLKRLPVGFDFLNGVFTGPAISFDKELAWVAARLARSANEITVFRTYADALETAFWGGDDDTIASLVEDLTSLFGHSFWLLELRIAIEQSRRGLEAQKKLAEEFRTINRRGLVSYIAHFTSVRNEPSATPKRFAQRMTARIAGTRYDGPIKAYLGYRLADHWPANPEGLAEILQVEQSHSPVDLYETFVAIAQHVACEGAFHGLAPHFQAALRKLIVIDDPRLAKLRLLFGDPTAIEHLPTKSALCTDKVFTGDKHILRKLIRETRKSGPGIDRFVAAAAALAPSSRRRLAREGTPYTFAVSRLAALLARGQDSGPAADELTKFCLNFSGFPTGRALLGLTRYLRRPNAPEEMRDLKVMSLNEVHLSPSEIHSVPEGQIDLARTALERTYPRSPTLAFHLAAAGVPVEESQNAAHQDVIALGCALGRARVGDYAGAIARAAALRQSPIPAISRAARLLEMNSLLQAGDRGQVIDMIASETVRREIDSRLLPVEAALGGLKWRAISAHGDRLSLAIALDQLWRQTNEDAVSTLRRFAFDEFLTRHQISRPSEIEALADKFALNELIYFLRYLSVPTVMDMSGAVGGSRELDLERRAVCALLSTLDKSNANHYRDEILEITHRILMEDGLRVVDSSRVHVDVDAIRQWAEKEFKESFARYMDLVEAGIGIADKFEDVLRSILKQDGASKYLDVPESEADELLVRMVHDLRERFLSDDAHGLDSYLSRRVRHNSMSGYLRGPVEECHLITQRDKSTGAYKPNTYWLDRLNHLNSVERSAAERHFRRFAEDFDVIINVLKNEIYHINGPRHPKGIFDIQLPPASYHLVRSAVQQSPSVSVLIDTCFRIFWPFLEPCLRRARECLNLEAKTKAAEAFQRLRAGLAGLPGMDRGFAELSQAIGDASAEVQREMDRVADWFNRTEINSSQSNYTLDLVINIAIESALATHRAFSPEIIRITPPDVGLQVKNLLIVADIIFIALDNVLTHSGVEPSPVIYISSEIHEHALCFRVTNEVAPGVRCAKAEAELEEIRRDIVNRAYANRLKEEGRSGLFKLASIVHSGKGRLEFGYDENDVFFVEVDLELVDVCSDNEEAADVCAAC